MSPTFEEQLAACTTSAEVRELCLAQGEMHGSLVREKDGSMRFSEVAPERIPMPAAQSASPAEATHLRVIYPSGNSRFEIYGTSEADLDAQEKKIRSLF